MSPSIRRQLSGLNSHLSSANTAVILAWIVDPSVMPFQRVSHPFFDLLFPLHLSQNLITTSLIAVKVYRGHLLSRRAGLLATQKPSRLVTVLRIIVESAAVYTIQLALLLVFYFAGVSAGEIIVLGSLPPSIGE